MRKNDYVYYKIILKNDYLKRCDKNKSISVANKNTFIFYCNILH